MQFHFLALCVFPSFDFISIYVCAFSFFLNDIFVHYFMRTSFFPFSVLRNVLWVERGDAQTNRDLQAIGCHYTTSFAILICRGNILQTISKLFILNIKTRLVIKNLTVLITLSFLQHQTQVAMAVDRAKQITMAELNAVMQVSVR